MTGAGNVFWKVIQTNWKTRRSSPPTGKYAPKDGSTHHLFTTGGNIHMIVLYTARSTYWVVNTLRDELSNETMIAIAKGLQPLGQVT